MASRPSQLVLAVCILGFLVPGAAGAPWTGPGQAGMVPVGLGDAALLVPAAAAEGHVVTPLTGIPAEVCRIVLDANGTNRDTRLSWSPAEGVARVYAVSGAAQARFLVHAAWVRDTAGQCTGERTTAGVLWHDPAARPFVDLSLRDEEPIFRPDAGGVFPFAVVVENNGTLPDNVTMTLWAGPEGWDVRSEATTISVPVPARGDRAFQWAVGIPHAAPPRMNLVKFNLSADSGWQISHNVFFEVQPEEVVIPEGTAWSEAPPAPRPASVQEGPGPAPVLVALVIMAVLALVLPARRRVP